MTGINQVQVGAHKLDTPRSGHNWRGKDGEPYAAVSVGTCTLVFSDPQLARDLAAECEKAARALEQMAAEDGAQ